MDSSRILLQINHISVVCGRLIWFFRRFLLKKESGFVQNLAVNQSHLSSLCSLWWCRLILGQSRFRSGGRPWWSPRSTSCLSIPLASQTQCRPHASHSRSSCCTIQPLFFAVLCWCISAHSHGGKTHHWECSILFLYSSTLLTHGPRAHCIWLALVLVFRIGFTHSPSSTGGSGTIFSRQNCGTRLMYVCKSETLQWDQ